MNTSDHTKFWVVYINFFFLIIQNVEFKSYFLNYTEFNSVLSRMLVLTNTNVDEMRVQNETWAQQLKDAMNVNGGDIENASAADYIMHFLTFGFKVSFMADIWYWRTFFNNAWFDNITKNFVLYNLIDHICIDSTCWSVGWMAMFLCIPRYDWIVDSDCRRPCKYIWLPCWIEEKCNR